MDRKDFLQQLGVGIMLITTGSLLYTCKKEDPTPTSVDFTIDLNDPVNSDLSIIGKSIYKNDVIITQVISGNYVAVSKICTHQQCMVEKYDSSGQKYTCLCHGSTFKANGEVINGPATIKLKEYSTSLTGNMLRVFF